MSHRLVSHSWLIADLGIVYNLLHETYKDMSRWDVYQAEVESGHLEWGDVHSTPRDWKARTATSLYFG
jgi:hypothetical protein